MNTDIAFIVICTILFLAECVAVYVVAKRHDRSGMLYCVVTIVTGVLLDIGLQNFGFGRATTAVAVLLAPACSVILAIRPLRDADTSV